MSSPPVAIVTGSSRGIGRAIARQLARDGFQVVVNYFSSPEAAEEVTADIARQGGRAVAVQADVGRPDEHAKLIDAALRLGGLLDLLVNNAGITSQGRKDLLEATEQSWDRVMATNLKGPFFLAQAAANAMIHLRGQGTIPSGKIINISSLSAYAATTNRADYCIAKAGMWMMTHLLADRLAGEAIQVFELCPGIIRSDMTAPVQEMYDRRIAEGLTPIRRWGEPEDVARAVSAIVGDYFPFSTGSDSTSTGGIIFGVCENGIVVRPLPDNEKERILKGVRK